MRFFYLLSMLGSPVAAAFLARRLNRSALLWALMCFFSPLAVSLIYFALPHTNFSSLKHLLPPLTGPAFLVGMWFLPPAENSPHESAKGFVASLIALAVLIAAFLFTLLANFPAQH